MSGRRGMERVWFLSPAIATAVFFAVQLCCSFTADRHEPRLAGATAEAPRATNVEVRVVEQIRAVEAGPRPAKPVPRTEAELMQLFRQDGAVVFFQDEVEVVETPSKRFAADEVEVIRLRRGTLKR